MASSTCAVDVWFPRDKWQVNPRVVGEPYLESWEPLEAAAAVFLSPRVWLAAAHAAPCMLLCFFSLQIFLTHGYLRVKETLPSALLPHSAENNWIYSMWCHRRIYSATHHMAVLIWTRPISLIQPNRGICGCAEKFIVELISYLHSKCLMQMGPLGGI